MSFTANIPASGQSLGNSRTQVLNNFAVLRSTIAVNHYDVNDATNGGKHKFVTMPPQVSSPATLLNELTLFTKTLTSGAALFYTRDNNTAFDVQLTTSAIAAPTVAANGETFIPGGIIIKWGFEDNVGTGTVSFPVAFPNNCFNVWTTAYFTGSTPLSLPATVNVRNPSLTTGFVWTMKRDSNSYTGFYWMAMGN